MTFRFMRLIMLITCVMPFCLSGHAAAVTPIKIAVVSAKTGIAATDNVGMFNAVRMGANEINLRGGLLGRPIELLEYDNESTAIGSKHMALKAVKEGVFAVIGATWSSHSLAMAPVLQKNKIIMITPVSTHPDITKGRDYVFRACFLNDVQGRAMAGFASSALNAKTAAVIVNTDNKYSPQLAREFVLQFQKKGGEIVVEEDYLISLTDLPAMLMRVKKMDVDVIYLPGYQKDSAEIIKIAYAIGLKKPFLGGDGWYDDMFDIAGKSLQGNYYTSHWHKTIKQKKSRAFTQKFEKTYGPRISGGMALAYDAIGVLADAVERAKSLDRSKVRDALAQTARYEGVTGNIMFDADGDPVKQVIILAFGRGESNYVKTILPDEVALGAQK